MVHRAMVPTRSLFKMLALVLLVAALASAAEYFSHRAISHPEDQTIGAGNPTFDEVLKRFGDVAKQKGAAYAYDVLREAKLPAGTDVHLVAHAIGHVLYQQQGLKGMAICTQEFGNGCSHALVIEAMQQEGDGDDVRARIDEACHSAAGGLPAYTMCYHGLGHGVFAFYEYDLAKTVAFCMKTGTAQYGYEQAYECIGGAAMELVSGGGHDQQQWLAANKKYFSAKDPLAPCDTDVIPSVAKPRCYVYLSPHYMQYAGANMVEFNDAQLTKGMSVCAALPHGEDRQSCIGGFGKDFVADVGGHDLRKRDQGNYSDDDLKQVEAYCKHAPDTTDVYDCEAFALTMVYWGGYADPNLSVRFCSDLSDAGSQKNCFWNLAGNIAHTVADPAQRSARCAALDEQYRSRCETPA